MKILLRTIGKKTHDRYVRTATITTTGVETIGLSRQKRIEWCVVDPIPIRIGKDNYTFIVNPSVSLRGG